MALKMPSAISTGTSVLSSSNLLSIGNTLLDAAFGSFEDLSLHVKSVTSDHLVPSFHSLEQTRNLIIHSATSTTGGLEGDLEAMRKNQHVFDCSAYIETRATQLARRGDFVIGRCRAWEAASIYLNFDDRGIMSWRVTNEEYYYLSQVILLEALNSIRSEKAGGLHALTTWLNRYPTAVVRVYTLDLEMQIFLLWLMKESGLESLRVESNSSEVATKWNQKGPMYPYVSEARELELDGTSDWKIPETSESELFSELGLSIPTLPGYRINNSQPFFKLFYEQLIAAHDLLRERHKVEVCCLKASNAGDGARVFAPIYPNDRASLRALAEEASQYEDDYVLEAFVDYRQVNLAAREYKLVLSGHVRYGKPLPTLTLQVLRGNTWIGNYLVSYEHKHSAGLSACEYNELVSLVRRVSVVFGSSLITGGIDFGLGTIGEHRNVCVAQDLNLSSHGAEYLRLYCDSKREFIDKGFCAGTRVFLPVENSDVASLAKIVSGQSNNKTVFDVVCVVPGKWGMIACLSSSIESVAEGLDRVENFLSNEGYAYDVEY